MVQTSESSSVVIVAKLSSSNITSKSTRGFTQERSHLNVRIVANVSPTLAVILPTQPARNVWLVAVRTSQVRRNSFLHPNHCPRHLSGVDKSGLNTVLQFNNKSTSLTPSHCLHPWSLWDHFLQLLHFLSPASPTLSPSCCSRLSINNFSTTGVKSIL